MRKATVIAIIALMCSATMSAQTSNENADDVKNQKELVKARRQEVKQAEKNFQKVAKDVKKQAKQLEKQGWKPATGTLPIEKQLSEMFKRMYTYEGNFPKYIIGRSTATSSSAGVAHKHALTRARVDVAGQIKLEIAALTEETTTNTELSAGEVETISKMVDTNQTMIQQTLGRTEIVLDIVRQTNDKYEEQIAVSYDGARAKDTLLKIFDNDNAEIKQKLQEMLNK